jgi:ABC-type thiamin/hydroxymethylpyrimidine transport system permease subunit
MKFTTRELVTLGVFGALWGGVEISLGSLLHTLNIPMRGIFLSAVGLLVAMVGRYFVPRVGSTLFVGMIAALLKMLSLGGIVVWPMIAIAMEAILAELILSTLRKPSRVAFIFTGAVGVFYTLVHPFLTQGLLAGQGVLFVWEILLEEGTRLFGLPLSAAVGVIGLMAAIRLIIGAIAGLIAWDAARVVNKRLVIGSEIGMQERIQ